MSAPTKNAGWEVKIAHLDARVDSFEMELRQQGRRQEEGFEKVDRNFAQLFARVDAATTRPVPWAIIVSSIVGVAGLGITTATGLALWANAYFGTSIRNAEARAKEATGRIDRVSDRLDHRIEKLTELSWETRLNLPRRSFAPSASLRLPAAEASAE